jgi:hypothetical protein
LPAIRYANCYTCLALQRFAIPELVTALQKKNKMP